VSRYNSNFSCKLIATASFGFRSAMALDVDILVTFRGELPDNVDIDDVEVIEKRERAFFGEIEPDWMSNPEANE